MVVTAQKQAEDLTKVPISITVLSGDKLGSAAVNDLDDLSRAVPGLAISVGTNEGQASLQLRGVSASAGAATVSQYLNEAPITIQYAGAIQPIPFDIGQIEVLRGPQGTLYGALSEGGSIRVIQNKPNLTSFNGFVAGDISGTEHGGLNYEASALQNIPIINDQLAIRVGALYGGDSGWIDNYNLDGSLNNRGVNSDTKRLVRVAALYEPSDDLQILGNFTYQRFDQKAQSAFYTALGTSQSLGLLSGPGYQTTSGLFKQSAEVGGFSHDCVIISDLEVTKKFSFGDVTSVTTANWREQKSAFDGTFFNSGAIALFLPGIGLPVSLPVAFVPSPAYNPYQGADTLTQELRITSPSDWNLPIKYIAGLYVSDQRTRQSNVEYANGLPAALAAATGQPALSIISQLLGGATNVNLATLTQISANAGTTRDDQYAAYGQLTYEIIPDLKLAVGVRYSFTREFDSYQNNPNSFFEFGLPAQEGGSSNTYAFTPRFSLSYDIDDKTSIYTTEAKGYRPGGPIFGIPSGPTNPPDTCLPSYQQLGIGGPPSSYRPDTLWSYEGGVKSTLADRTLSINAAGYYIDWNDIQQSISLPACGFAFTASAGNAAIYGSELELLYAPPIINGLKLGLNAAFNHGAITKIFPGANFAQVGEALENVPERTLSVSLDYDTPIANMVGFFHIDYDFQGHAHGAFQQTIGLANGTTAPNPQFENKAYGVANLQIGVNADSWKAYLFAKNLLNDHTIYQQINDATVTTGYTTRPLTIGIGGRKDF